MKSYSSLFFTIFLTLLSFFYKANAQDEGKNWALVVSKGAPFTAQVWRNRTYFPKKEIAEFWNKGYAVSSITHNLGTWSVIFSKGLNYGQQYFVSSVEFPEDLINDYWEKNYRVTNIAYGDNNWTLFMATQTPYYDQKLLVRDYFPESDIKDLWGKGYFITTLEYGKGNWVVVLSKGTGYSTQSYRTRSYFPKNEIKELWDSGHDITSLSFGDDTWAVVMSKGINYNEQLWKTSNSFPEKEIRDFWDKGYYITGIHHGLQQANQNPKIPLPEITWNKPAASLTRVTQSEFVLKACVKSQVPITRVTVYINGAVPILTESTNFEVVPGEGCDVTVERKIRLTKGNNEIKLVITNKAGSTTADIRQIQYDATSNPTQVATDLTKEKKIAFLIGNAGYSGFPLKSPLNNVRLLEASLKSIGFDVLKFENLGSEEIKKALADFGTKLKDYKAALFYFSGYGMQLKGNNLMLPVGTNFTSENETEKASLSIGQVLSQMENAGIKHKLLFIDAITDHNFDRPWLRSTQNNGLISADVGSGTMLSFSGDFGKVISEGNSNLGFYAEELAKQIKTPNLKMTDILKKIQEEVVRRSNNTQDPRHSNYLSTEFYLLKK